MNILSATPSQPKEIHAAFREFGKHTKPAVVLNVKVKTINDDIPKGTRTLPALSDWAKSSPQESGERDSTVLGEDTLVRGIGTTDGEQDLLTSRLADGNILHDLMAAGQQLGYNAIISNVDRTVALVAKIGARPVSRAHIGEIVDETNINDVQGGLLTEVAQTELVRTLTLQDNDQHAETGSEGDCYGRNVPSRWQGWILRRHRKQTPGEPRLQQPWRRKKACWTPCWQTKKNDSGIKSQPTTAQERSVDGEGQRKDADKCLQASRTVSQRTKTCEVGRPDQREGEISSMGVVDMTVPIYDYVWGCL